MRSRVRTSHQEVFCKKGVLSSFAKFTGKQLWQSLFFNKVVGLGSATSLKKRLWHRRFFVNFAKFIRTSFLTRHLRWLLLPCRELDLRLPGVLVLWDEKLLRRKKNENFCKLNDNFWNVVFQTQFKNLFISWRKSCFVWKQSPRGVLNSLLEISENSQENTCAWVSF